MTRRNQTKPKLPAQMYVEQDSSVVQLVVQIHGAVIGVTGYEFPGTVEMRAFVNRQSAEAFGHCVTFHGTSPDLGELRAAVRKIERMNQRMQKMDKELGAASTFAEFVRRGLSAAGVEQLHVARDAAGRPRSAAHYIAARVADGAAVLDAAGRLEKVALMLFGLRAEAA